MADAATEAAASELVAKWRELRLLSEGLEQAYLDISEALNLSDVWKRVEWQRPADLMSPDLAMFIISFPALNAMPELGQVDILDRFVPEPPNGWSRAEALIRVLFDFGRDVMGWTDDDLGQFLGVDHRLGFLLVMEHEPLVLKLFELADGARG